MLNVKMGGFLTMSKTYHTELTFMKFLRKLIMTTSFMVVKIIDFALRNYYFQFWTEMSCVDFY